MKYKGREKGDFQARYFKKMLLTSIYC